ncbi:pantoate--beta-alanine ligase [Paenibacillus psychroresistens]|uniref:Pantothenate synthetase n=1 Tax=Paenibacillus psychroresistens TaxID=1778678 RepID=A0A6B8RLC4_9BACL|nr:pantoate--beta-alanine ligase [Paenibacillus psychroresistens]QGQ96839.1 pantoate--beta-alanine ligase [Paenibacillus psychroresistens]
MEVIQTVAELRSKLNERKKHYTNSQASNYNSGVGFVPTMGFLHAGHASLLQQARQDCDIVVLSIFVNPLQFGPKEDFERYPRDPERDLALARQAEVDYVFMPETAEMYPEPIKTMIKVSDLTDKLDGASRPGHFDGVATVVAKLLHIVEPDRVYFGLKDAQQVVVIQRMVKDLHMRTVVVPCSIVREADGLAMSSRNVYLSAEERKQSLVLSQALNQVSGWLEASGEIKALEQQLTAYIQTAALAEIDYVKALSYPSLLEIAHIKDVKAGERLIVALAVKFGRTRLIDNNLLDVN